MLSILAGILLMGLLLNLVLNVGFLSFRGSFILVLFLNHSDLPVSLCALLFTEVTLESLLI